MAVVRGRSVRGIPDGTDPEDLAIFLRGWRRYQQWAGREGRVEYDARLNPLLRRLEEHVQVLQWYAALPAEALLADRRNADGAQHRLFLALVAAIDATKWLAGKVRVSARPWGFAQAFDLLVEAGALPAEKRAAYVGFARLRNWIAHEAVALPPRKVRALVRHLLPLLEEYGRVLRSHQGV